MSTKIFNGYILPSTSLTNLKKMCFSLREMLQDVHVEVSHKKFAEICCAYIDQNHFGIEFYNFKKNITKHLDSEKRYFVPYIETFKKISKQQQDNQGKFHDLNFEFNITFIPSGKNILALTYCNYEEKYLPYWEALPNISEYKYWNSTDQPKHLSEKEWNNRAKKWDKALESTPIESGFNIMILSNNVIFNANKIIEFQPSTTNRIKSIIELNTIHNRFKDEKDNSLTVNDSIKLYMQIKRDINDGTINTDDLYKKIKPDIRKLTENNLMEKIEINSNLSLIN